MSRRRSIPSALLEAARRIARRGALDDERTAADVSGSAPPFLIVGLGNPGRRYHATRHNAGFMAIEQVSRRLPAGSARTRLQAEILETHDGDARVVLAKPQTFMNDSGLAVSQLLRWYKTPRQQLLVIYDELDLPFGTLRLRGDGSAGGHNGMKSIIQQLGSQDFARLRIGIGRPSAGANVPYVLSAFNDAERRQLDTVLERAADAALMWRRQGIIAAMNDYNRRDEGGDPAKHTLAPLRRI
jgi:peptidyl-tRNA hydrolase, PTH1 family